MSNENRTNINPPRRMRGPMGGGRMGSGEKAKDFKGTIGKLIRYIGNYKYGVFAVFSKYKCRSHNRSNASCGGS